MDTSKKLTCLMSCHVQHTNLNQSFYDLEFHEEYYKQLEATNVVDVNVLPKDEEYRPCGYVLPVRDHHVKSTRILLKYLAVLALRRYYWSPVTGFYRFKKLVKATAMGCNGVEYYITFLAKDATRGVNTFQAAALYGIGKVVVWSCELKTTN